jgi:hypothetical protein
LSDFVLKHLEILFSESFESVAILVDDADRQRDKVHVNFDWAWSFVLGKSRERDRE